MKLALASVVPAALMLACILVFGVDVPWHDEWVAIGPVFEQASLGTLDLSDLTAQHNVHRIFFPKLVALALGAFGRWDVRREMIVTFCIAAATAWNVHALLRATVPGSPKKIAALSLLACLLVCSPAQWSNWLMGMQMALFVPPLCVTTAWRVARSGLGTGVRVGLALLLCAVSTFSVGNGFLAWIVVLPAFASSRRIVATFGAALAVCIALYRYGFTASFGGLAPSFVLEHPVESLAYAAAFLGSTFASWLGEGRLQVGTWLGVLQVVLFGACCARLLVAGGEPRSRALPWISLGAYAILTAGVTALTRAGEATSPVAPRYVTFSLWLGVSLAGLLALVAERDPVLRIASLLGGALLAFGALAPWPEALRGMREARSTHLYGKACLAFAGVLDDLPEPRAFQKRAADLRERVLRIDRGGYFHPPLVKSLRAEDLAEDPAAECGTLRDLVRRGALLVASGRAELPSRGGPPDAILLACEGRIFAVCPADSADWSASFAAAKLPPDAASVSAWAFDAQRGRAFRIGDQGIPSAR